MRRQWDNFLLLILIIMVLPALSVGKTVKQAHRRRLLPRSILGWAAVLIVITLAIMAIKQTAWWSDVKVPVQSISVSQPSTPI